MQSLHRGDERSHGGAKATSPELQQPPPPRGIAVRLLMRLAAAALTLPVAMVVTLGLFPVWSWLERTTGIESMGREGPASWCYLTVWGLMAVAVLAPTVWRAIQGAGTQR